MGKVKYSVARFVQVMSGGNVVIDSGWDGPLAAGLKEYDKLVALQAELATHDLTADALEKAIADYSSEADATTRETDKIARTRRFDALIKATRAQARAFAAEMATWREQAQRQQALIDAIKQGLAAQRSLVDRVPVDGIRTRLAGRLKGLEDRLVFGDTVERLPVTIAVLEQVQADLVASDVDRYARLAAQFGDLNTAVIEAIRDTQGPVAGLQPSELGALMDARLKAIEARRAELSAPAKDLFDLAFKCQELADLRAELDAFDAAALQAKVDTYKDLEAKATQTLQKNRADLARLPDTAIKPILQAQLDTFARAVKPVDGIGGPQALDRAIITLRTAAEKHATAGDGFTTRLEAAQDYLDRLAQLDDAHAAKSAEVAALPPSLVRDAMKGSLATLHASATPFAQAQDLMDLKDNSNALAGILSTMKAFDVASYQKLAARYQEAAATWHYDFTLRSREVAALPDGPVKAVLQGTLDRIDADFLPLDRITSPKEVDQRTKGLTGLQTRTRAVDAAGVADAIRLHADLVASAMTAIDDKMTEVGATLSPGSQRLLRDGFLKEYTPLVTYGSIDELSSRTQALQALQDRVAQYKVTTKAPPEAIAKADQRVASTSGRIDTVTPPERQKQARAALDKLVHKLDQLRIGLPPDGMPAELAVGAAEQAGVVFAKLKPSEHMQALNKAIAALEKSLDDPTGQKMLDVEGGEKLAEGFARMYNTLAAFGANHKSVSPAEALAVRRYTGDDYSAMNLNRRGIVDDDRLAFLNATCDTALAKMPDYPEVAWPVFRAETAWSQDVVDKRYAKGRQFVCGVLWSTGARGTADISTGSPRFVHVIHGKKGRDVAALSANTGEGATQQRGHDFNPAAGRGEVLFPADSTFVVEGRTDPPGAPESIRYSPENSYNIITTKLREVLNG